MKMKTIYISLLFGIFTHQLVNSQAVWTQYDGPYSGNVWSYASTGDTLLCGSIVSGIYFSLDKGFNWEKIGESKVGYLYAIFYYKSHLFASWSGTGSFVSEDKGENWSECNTLPYTKQFYLFKNNLFAATDQGIFLFDTLSNLWIDKSNGLPPENSSPVARNIRCISSAGNTLFIGSLINGLYFSDDFGNNWNQVLVSSGLDASQILTMTCSNDTLYIPNDYDDKIYTSVDTGKSWNPILNLEAVYEMACYNGSVYIASYSGLYEYNPKNSDFVKRENDHFISVNANDGILLASTYSGLYRLDNETDKLILSNTGINTSEVYDLGIFKNLLFSATTQGVYFNSNESKNWNLVDMTKNTACYTIATQDTTLYLGTKTGIIATNNLENWFHLDNGLSTEYSKMVWDIEISDTLLYAATAEGLYKSDNRGQNWTYVKGNNAEMKKIAIGNNMTLISSYHGLYKLSENSDSVYLIGFNEKDITTVKIIDGNVYIGVIGVDNGLYKSIDSCKSWTKISDLIIWDLNKRGNDNLYAGGIFSILYSPDAGSTWEDWSEVGIPNYQVNCILQSDNAFYAGTIGNSIYKRSYLNLIECSSEKYTINNSSIEDIPLNASLDSLLANIELAHGASIRIIENTSNRTMSFSSNMLYLNNDDKIEIIAEDAVTSRIFTINNYTNVASTDAELKSDVIFPNPAFNILNIRTSHSTIAKIWIFDMQGNQILSECINDSYIDISSLKKGIYIFKLEDNNNIMINKFVKE